MHLSTAKNQIAEAMWRAKKSPEVVATRLDITVSEAKELFQLYQDRLDQLEEESESIQRMKNSDLYSNFNDLCRGYDDLGKKLIGVTTTLPQPVSEERMYLCMKENVLESGITDEQFKLLAKFLTLNFRLV